MTEAGTNSRTAVFKRPYFWLLFTVLSSLCAIFTVRYFSRAFPVVNIDLKMDRRAALDEARRIAARHNWGPAGYHEAAAFDQDDQFQYYVELTAGGNEEFSRITDSGIYSPYTWDVRHFKAGEIFESVISFTPDGKPYGFSLDLPEEQPGPTIPAASARAIAERTAVTEWQVALSSFQLIDSSLKMQPSGRTDHTFVYERAGVRTADARYRLRLVVCGDRLTGLNYFVKIPESFSLHYQEIRSANNTIADIATIIAGLLYVLGGCAISLFFLARKRWTLVFPALQLALIISFLQVLSDINALPLGWMGYDTAISFNGYIANQVFRTAVKFLADAALLALSFIAAESITRRAFPGHLQLWRVWEPAAASSKQVLGRTIAGYLLVAVFCAYQVVLYFVTRKALGWWTPSDSLIEPDLFATYLPWFTPFAQAAHAGLWEECLFRAVPIGVAAIIGQRYGKRNLFIVVALFLQAFIFGAAHANYPGEPAYARLVELILPSLGFGLLYIYFGLLPGMVLHFAFDSTLMSIPLMISSAPGIWVSKTAMILFSLVPLGVVCYARLRTGRWSDIPEGYYNRSWFPPADNESVGIPTDVTAEIDRGRKLGRSMYVLGVVGIVMWGITLQGKSLVPSLTISRTKAVALAKEAWQKQGIRFSALWKGLAAPQAQPGLADTFIWQKGGKRVYLDLMKKGYLEPPVWETRFALFDGDTNARAEEFIALYTDAGDQVSSTHVVPESRAGAVLNEQKARETALKAVYRKYGIPGDGLKEISADSNRLPERMNWQFTFNRPADYPLKEGQARIEVRIDGGEVTGLSKYIYVPEQWARSERNARNIRKLVSAAGAVIIAIVYATAIGFAITAWIRKEFSIAAFLLYGGVFFILNLISIVNRMPLLYARLSTAEPVVNQLLTYVGYSLLGILFTALTIGVMNGYIKKKLTTQNSALQCNPALLGFAAGFLLSGVLSVLQEFVPSLSPRWPSFGEAGAFSPAAGICLSVLTDYIRQVTVYLFIFVLISAVVEKTKNLKYVLYAVLMLIGWGIAAGRSDDSIIQMTLAGIVIGNALFFGYKYIFRFRLSLLPFAVAGVVVTGILRQAFYAAFPGAIPGGIASAAMVVALSCYWHNNLKND